MAAQLHPAMLRLIQALAQQAAAEDYLAAQAAQQQPEGGERTKPVPLPATEWAA